MHNYCMTHEENTCRFLHVCIGLSESAHSQARECALTGPRVRTRRPESAHSFLPPSTHVCRHGATPYYIYIAMAASGNTKTGSKKKKTCIKQTFS